MVNHSDIDADIACLVDWSNDDLFSLEPAFVASFQLEWLQRRFATLRPKLAAIDRLAGDLCIDRIGSLDGAVPLCLPHTMYKAYSIADIDKGRWARLTGWLQTLTTHDLSRANVDGCRSIDDWLDRLEAATPLRPQVSSGTSGKISIFPRGESEGRLFMEGQIKMFSPFRDEPGLDLHGGKFDFISPWPADTGRHHLTATHQLLRRHIYGGRHDGVITLSSNRLSADELWLTGKIRRAEANGEELWLTQAEHELRARIAESAGDFDSQLDGFIDRAVIGQRGRKVALISSWSRVYQFAAACHARGVVASYAPGSMFCCGGGVGGLKGSTLPDGFEDIIRMIFPAVDIVEAYGFSETSSVAKLCPEGFYHQPPWGIPWVLDPLTSQPLPRSGVATGRMALFDLSAVSYWAGTISGDEVTMHWEGGCACGRKGPYLEKTIRRYSEAQGGDDKISCSKTPDAYENLVEFALSVID